MLVDVRPVRAEVWWTLMRRWRMVVTEVSSRRSSGEVDREGGNMNLISSWTEQSLALITRQVNVSELSQLREIIRALETAQVEVVKQRVALDELSIQVGVNSPVFQQTMAKVDQMLPKRLHYLAEKGEEVSRLVEMVEGGARWVEEAKEKRTSNSTAQEQLKLRLAVSDKEYEMNQVFNEFLLLEREVTGAGMDVNSQLAKEVRSLKDSWFSLVGDVRRVSNTLNGNVTTSTTTLLTSNMAVSSSPDRSISSYQVTPSTLGNYTAKSRNNVEVTSQILYLAWPAWSPLHPPPPAMRFSPPPPLLLPALCPRRLCPWPSQLLRGSLRQCWPAWLSRVGRSSTGWEASSGRGRGEGSGWRTQSL